jgi:hypothetical protein
MLERDFVIIKFVVTTVDTRYFETAYFEIPLILKLKKCAVILEVEHETLNPTGTR